MNNILQLQGNVVTSAMTDKIFLFYGAPGTWKTTVAAGDKESTLLLAYEIGYKFIPGIRALNLSNWHGMKDAIRQLNTPEAKELYKTVAIDTIGLAYKKCIDYICAREGVTSIGKIPYGQGYGMAKNEFEKVMHQIPQMGYGLIMVAHSDEMNDEEQGVSIKVDIDKRPSSVIKGMADFILYARKESRDASDGEGMGVYAYSESNNPNVEVKSRARFFPKRFLFTYENVVEGLKVAIEKQNEFFGTESIDKPDFSAYQETKIDLIELQKEVGVIARELIDTPLADDVRKILIEELKGTGISKTEEIHIPALYTVRDRLLNLKNRS